MEATQIVNGMPDQGIISKSSYRCKALKSKSNRIIQNAGMRAFAARPGGGSGKAFYVNAVVIITQIPGWLKRWVDAWIML